MTYLSYKKIFIHAPNVHNGGGKELLSTLIQNVTDENNVCINVDERMCVPKDIARNCSITKVKPNILSRLKAELRLAKDVMPNDLLLCFGNLPPLFNIKGKVVVFVQNRYLVDNVCLKSFLLRTRIRLIVEKFWLSAFSSNVNVFFVQTPAMKSLLIKKINFFGKVCLAPYVDFSAEYSRKSFVGGRHKDYEYDFVYIASGEPHKNHKVLIEAWCILSKQNIFPSLCLTLSEKISPDLCDWIKLKEKEFKLNILNVGQLKKDEVNALYDISRTLIYPSSLESFGMPLIEARQAGLFILASELDYVRDILDPDEVFESGSAISISRAVKRHLKIDEPILPLIDSKEFLNYVCEKSR